MDLINRNKITASSAANTIINTPNQRNVLTSRFLKFGLTIFSYKRLR